MGEEALHPYIYSLQGFTKTLISGVALSVYLLERHDPLSYRKCVIIFLASQRMGRWSKLSSSMLNFL